MIRASLMILAAACALQAQTNPLIASQKAAYDRLKTNLVKAAEKMPEEAYSFKPTPEIRAFGQIFGHVANAQYGTCAAVKGVPNPNQGTNLEQKTTKAEFTKALADSFAFCDEAFSSLTDANVTEMVKQGQNEVTRAGALAGLIAHGNELYGTAAVYLRLKGIVPPTTERQMQRGRGGN